MYILTWKTVAVGLILAAGVYAYKGQLCCMPGMNGNMQSAVSTGSNRSLSSVAAKTDTLKITATMLSPVKTGENALDIVITNLAGKPITAARVTTQVAMTSMDMGTDYPSVKETGKGHYTTTVAFSMAGPWRVTVKVVAPGQISQAKSFDFTAS